MLNGLSLIETVGFFGPFFALFVTDSFHNIVSQDAAFASLISMLQSPLFNQLLNIQQSAAAQNAEELQYANEDFAPLSESKLPQWLNGPVSEAPSHNGENLIAANRAPPVVRMWHFICLIKIKSNGQVL